MNFTNAAKRVAKPLTLSFALAAAPLAGAAFAQDAPKYDSFSCNTPKVTNLSLPEKLDVLMPATVRINIKIKLTEEALQQELDHDNQLRQQMGTPLLKEIPKELRALIGTYQTRELGSGYVVDPRGYIVTNNHVAEGGMQPNSQATVVFYDPNTKDNEGQEVKARIVGLDKKTDIAVLKVDLPNPLSCVVFGDSNNVKLGESVIAVGSGLGESFSVSLGIISNKNRNQDNPSISVFQTDATINKGNSGGPLFDNSGRVIGMNSSILSQSGGSVGIGFALKSNKVSKNVNELIRYGKVKRGWLGVSMQSLTPTETTKEGLTNHGGIRIQVGPDTPAEKSGLKTGDVVTAVNGKNVSTPFQMASILDETEPGDHVILKIMRDGEMMNIDTTLGDQEAYQKQRAEKARAQLRERFEKFQKQQQQKQQQEKPAPKAPKEPEGSKEAPKAIPEQNNTPEAPHDKTVPKAAPAPSHP